MIQSKTELFFDDPRFKMTFLGRFAVRFTSYVSYGTLTAAAISFSLSDVKWLHSLGLLTVLFLVDRLSHFGQAEKSLARVTSRKVNLSDCLTPESFRIIERAFNKSLIAGDFMLNLALNLLNYKEIKEGLLKLEANPEDFKLKLNQSNKFFSTAQNDSRGLLNAVENLLKFAAQYALKEHDKFIEPKDLFLALSDFKNSEAAKLFDSFDIKKGDLENALILGRYKSRFSGLKKLPASLVGFAKRPFRVKKRIMNRAWTAGPTPLLDKYSEDLTALARMEKMDFLIGHAKEFEQLVSALARFGNPAALLVGDPGSGKGTLVAHLAYGIITDSVPSELFDKRIVSLDLGRLIAGADEGILQDRIEKIIQEIIKAGNIILHISDIHNLARTSGSMLLSAADVLIPAIKSNEFQVIGFSHPKEFKKYIEADKDFSNIFETIYVQEISENEAVRVLIFSSLILESRYKIAISFAAIKQAVLIAHRYFHQKLLPSSADDLLKDAAAEIVKLKKKALTGNDVVEVAQRKISIPLQAAKEIEADKLLDLEKSIHKKLIDQEPAVRSVAMALREYRAGLARKDGPIASFLFVGPTGVGKTELAKILAKIQFGSSDAMIRFDMSENQTKESIYRFIGSPSIEIEGTLAEAVLRNPYSLILLDEFEKSHPDILNLFLQVFDEGRLTDSFGRLIDFKNTILIATSNAHSNFIKSEIDKGGDIKDISDELKKKLTELFRPELLNRFSGIIVFKSLAPSQLENIVKIQLADLASVVMESQNINLFFENSAIQKIAELGYDPAFGARPLRNAIAENIKSVLAEEILKGKIKKGHKVVISFDKEFKFNYL